MDNDVHGTDYCIGFSTAVTRSVDFIHSLRTPTGSHEPIAVVELFGRYSGETSLIAAYLAGVDRAVISEVGFDVERLVRMLVEHRQGNPSHYAVMTISEGAKPISGEMSLSGEADAYGHKKLGGVGLFVSREIERLSGVGTVFQQLAYLMRSSAPDALDRTVSTSYGYLATNLMVQRRSGRMVALRDGKYTTVSANAIAEGKKRVDVDELCDVGQYRPKVAHLLGKPMFLTDREDYPAAVQADRATATARSSATRFSTFPPRPATLPSSWLVSSRSSATARARSARRMARLPLKRCASSVSCTRSPAPRASRRSATWASVSRTKEDAIVFASPSRPSRERTRRAVSTAGPAGSR